MGEVAGWIREGGGCEWCGTMLGDGGPVGYPRLCSVCATDASKRGYAVTEMGEIVGRPEDRSEDPMRPPVWWVDEMDAQRDAMERRSKAVGVLCGALFRIGQKVRDPAAAARRALEIIGAHELVALARKQAEEGNPKPLTRKVTMDHEREFLEPGAVTVGLTAHGFIGVWKDARSSPEPAGEGNTVEEAIYDAAVREGIVELGVSLSDLRKD